MLIYHISHNDVSQRVWVSGWPPDMFEIMNNNDFNIFRSLATRLGLSVVEYEESLDEIGRP